MTEIETLTPVYDETEDRIRLIVNHKKYSSRIDFMITRNLILKLLPKIDEFLQQNYEGLDFETGFEQNTAVQKNEQTQIVKKVPVLLTKVDMAFLNEKEYIKITFTGQDHHKAQAILTKELFYTFAKNLDRSLPKANWGISRLI